MFDEYCTGCDLYTACGSVSFEKCSILELIALTLCTIAAKLADKPIECCEDMQVVKYPVGGFVRNITGADMRRVSCTRWVENRQMILCYPNEDFGTSKNIRTTNVSFRRRKSSFGEHKMILLKFYAPQTTILSG